MLNLSYEERYPEIGELVGQTLATCTSDGSEIVMETIEGRIYKLYHNQDCCEHVYIESIDGDLSDLVGSPLVQADEISNDRELDQMIDSDESFTWTFYRLATIKGSVTVRFYGSSNGYYSESAELGRTQ